MDENIKHKLMVDALLKEYGEIRHESGTFEILQIVCFALSVLVFSAMFIVAVSSNQYILLFISPLFSIFFILLAIGMQAYITNLQLRSSQIEDLLRNIIGEPTIQWEATVGLFVRASGDILNLQVRKYFVITSLLVIIVGVTPIIISFSYGFREFYNSVGNYAWLILAFNVAAGLATAYVGYSFFFRRGWEKLKFSI